MDAIEKFEVNGIEVEIRQEEYLDESPRDWDNLGTMVCWHSRHRLGDKHTHRNVEEMVDSLLTEKEAESIRRREEVSWERRCSPMHGDEYFKANAELKEYIQKLKWDAVWKRYVFLPLYLYDHSGITMSTGAFSCPWDSGQVGYIYVSREKAMKEWSRKRWTKKFERDMDEVLKSEVKVYDQYLTGDVYYYTATDPQSGESESCGGYYGIEDCRAEAKGIAKALAKRVRVEEVGAVA